MIWKGAGTVLIAAACLAAAPAQSGLLPFDRTNPVFYDNDWTNDYIDWYLMAVASSGDIRYRGISTSSSIPTYNRHMTSDGLEAAVADRTRIVTRGRNSGFRNVPDPVRGTRGHLAKPASGRIEDTVPVDSAGCRALIAEAKLATAAKPLVVCMGGPVTVAASAYLLDPSIADRMIVCFVDLASGMTGYNGWADGWAAYIALERLRLVTFAFSPSSNIPRLSKQWIQDNLPESEAKTHMLSLGLDVVNGSDGDADGMPAVAILRPDYVKVAKRVSFGGWITRDGHEMPIFRDDPNGRAIVVTQADGAIGTAEYQRALKNPAAWSSTPPPPPPPPPSPAPPSVTQLNLMNADTDQPIAGHAPLANGATIDLATLPSRNLTVLAVTSPSIVGSVRFEFDGNATYRVENTAPYALQGDASGDLAPAPLGVGQHTVGAAAYSASGATGTAGIPLTRVFTLIDSAPPPAPPPLPSPGPAPFPSPAPAPGTGGDVVQGDSGAGLDERCWGAVGGGLPWTGTLAGALLALAASTCRASRRSP